MKAHELPAEVSAAFTTIAWYFAGLMLDAAKQRATQDADGGYYDAKSSPMGPTGFLRLARAGAFPAFRMGRKLVARKVDVHAWIESQKRAEQQRRAAPQPRKGPRSDSPAAICDWMLEKDAAPSTERSR